MKIAIIITGELIIPNFKNLINSIKNYDIYISTYTQYYESAKKITNNILVSDKNDKTIFNKKTVPYNNIYQWWHLNNILSVYKEQFSKYDILLKIRSDCYFIEPINDKHFFNIDMNCFYMNSDITFYGSTKLFYYIYENFYHDILNKYIDNCGVYFKINYKNLISSYKNTKNLKKYNKSKYIKNIKYRFIRRNINIGLSELVYPTSVYSSNINILIKNIKKKFKKDIDNKTYCNFFASSNTHFGSEKFNFLNVVNKAVIKQYELPNIGVISKKN